jgi:hypothetical protein
MQVSQDYVSKDPFTVTLYSKYTRALTFENSPFAGPGVHSLANDACEISREVSNHQHTSIPDYVTVVM